LGLISKEKGATKVEIKDHERKNAE